MYAKNNRNIHRPISPRSCRIQVGKILHDAKEKSLGCNEKKVFEKLKDEKARRGIAENERKIAREREKAAEEATRAEAAREAEAARYDGGGHSGVDEGCSGGD